MKSEIFVVNAVKSSDKAFSAVAEHIDCLDADRLVKLLQSPAKVKQEERRLGLVQDQLFVYLEKIIRDSFERHPLPRLTYESVSVLLKNDVQKHLSGALDFPAEDDVLQTLFSVSALQDTLVFLGSATSRIPANAKLLLSEILKRDHAQRLQNTYATTSNNWEIILRNEEWLESDAVQKLLETEAGITSSNPYQVLASLIDEYNSMQESEEKPDEDAMFLGALSLLSIRRRISSIINNFYEQSILNAGNLPKSPIMRFLAPLINIYELGYVAKGIRQFMATPSKLREILPIQDYSPILVEEDKVDVSKPLKYFEEKTYTVSGYQLGNFEIRCTVAGKEQTILKVVGAPEWVCQQLKQDIPQIVPVKLREEGNTVCERLLNTSFPLEPEGIARLREAVSNMESAFIQAVVLSSDGKISGIPNVWGSPIPDRLQFDELPVANDPEYVTDVEEHIAKLMSRYGFADNVVRRGLKPRQQEPDQGEKE
jgi:hypothetical protein